MLGKIFDIVSLFLDGEMVNINYLNESEPSYAVMPVGDVKLREYLAGTSLRQFTFDIWCISPFGDDAKVNMRVIERMRELSKKLEGYEDDSYAFFAIDTDTPPVLASAGMSMAKYKMRMNVTYSA